MTIRIFNPDHDLALAANLERFTAPHAGRHLRSDLGYIPALWSDNGDIVIVEDIDAAESSYRKLKWMRKPHVEFATMLQLKAIVNDCEFHSIPFTISPWGWNRSIRFQLLNAGIPQQYLPSLSDVDEIRQLSNRSHTESLLPLIRYGYEDFTCGESHYCRTEEELLATIEVCSYHCVIKAPWSSSGRGIRYVIGDADVRKENTYNWMRNILAQQGGVMVEPLYSRVKDFAVEFTAMPDGSIHYSGLSLFSTQNGAYTGNLLVSDTEKRTILSEYLSLDMLDGIIENIMKNVKVSPYTGPFGIDMMIVADNVENPSRFFLHPCVEINLRCTMGHVALFLTSDSVSLQKRNMRISYTDKHYHLTLS